MNEIKVGPKLHYKIDPISGFWVALHPTDPQSATLTDQELFYTLESALLQGKGILSKIQERMDSVEKFIEFHNLRSKYGSETEN